MKRALEATLLTIALVLAACGSSGEPPRVIQAYPADGYHGFSRGEAIVISFDQPMDAAATEGAFLLTGPGGAPVSVGFAWEDGGRRLVVTPNDPVAYSLDDSYTTYRYRLSTGARSAAGLALAEPLDVSFTTLRTLSASLTSLAVYDGAVSRLGVVYNDSTGQTNYTPVRLGDTVANVGVRVFLAFDVSGVVTAPENVITALLQVYNENVVGNPFGGLGDVLVEKVGYLDDDLELDEDDYGLNAAAALEPVTGWNAGETKVFGVTDWLAAVLAAEPLNGDRRYLQLRFSFEQESNDDGVEDTLNLATGESADHPPVLEVTYFGP